MASKSSIRKLPPELRKELDRLLSDGRLTLREITDHVRLLGADVSKSAVHRYSQDFERVARDIRMAREVAAAVGKDLEETNGNVGRLAVESLQALVLRAQMQIEDEEGRINAKMLVGLSQAARDLASALKGSVETELKIRAQAAKDAAKAAAKVGAEQGLSTETIETIKERILGIARAT